MVGDAKYTVRQQLPCKGEVGEGIILTEHVLVSHCANSAEVVWHLALGNVLPNIQAH